MLFLMQCHRYYTIQEYKALSNEKKKELNDLHAYRGHSPNRRKFTKGSVKEQLAALEQDVSVLQSNHGTYAGTALKATKLAPQHLQMPQPTLKTLISAIILPSLINKPDARLKGTEKLMDYLEEEILSQIKIQPDTPMQSGLPELALSPSTVNLTVS